MSKKLDFSTLRSNYDMVIFDMDGVMTSEQVYWDCSALTAYEYLNSDKYFGSSNIDASAVVSDLDSVRKNILCEDRIISLCKNIGVNSNWDLAYVTIGLWLEFKDGKKCIDFLENCGELSVLYESVSGFISRKTGFPVDECRRNQKLWNMIVSCFQEWYLGDAEFTKMYSENPVQFGKPFLCEAEKPLLDLSELSRLLKLLTDSGLTLGVATGRNLFEISVPLKKWGIYDYFDPNRIITYDNVEYGEEKMRAKGIQASFVKPSPYCFLKSALGSDYDDEKIFNGEYNVQNRVIAVGDAGADIFAAQNAGFDFLAVLTGVNGSKARSFFEQQGATYINDSLIDILK